MAAFKFDDIRARLIALVRGVSPSTKKRNEYPTRLRSMFLIDCGPTELGPAGQLCASHRQGSHRSERRPRAFRRHVVIGIFLGVVVAACGRPALDASQVRALEVLTATGSKSFCPAHEVALGVRASMADGTQRAKRTASDCSDDDRLGLSVAMDGRTVVAGAPARVVRRWTAEQGWQPPLRTPAPMPIPDGTTPQQLRALLAFARCMRARGVTGLADPNPANGQISLPPGMAKNSPVVMHANRACLHLLPGNGG